jgi:hypothetical protein
VAVKQRQGRQLPADAAYVVAIHSDNVAIEDLEFAEACRYLDDEAREGGGTYAAIGAVLFDNGWSITSSGQRWFVWENQAAAFARRPSPTLLTHFLQL